MKKNSYSYCEGSYLSLKATMHKWGDPNWTRFLTRIFYNSMFGAGTNPTGFISESALQNKLNKEKTCQDHYLSPQFMGRMILDNQEKYLSDLETYTEIFNIACSTVEVTVEENSILSEGINVKGLEAVLFMRKMDFIGISQSIGRVIRKGDASKTFGLICVPVYDKVGISTSKSVQAVVDTVFKQGKPAISVVRS